MRQLAMKELEYFFTCIENHNCCDCKVEIQCNLVCSNPNDQFCRRDSTGGISRGKGHGGASKKG